MEIPEFQIYGYAQIPTCDCEQILISYYERSQTAASGGFLQTRTWHYAETQSRTGIGKTWSPIGNDRCHYPTCDCVGIRAHYLLAA